MPVIWISHPKQAHLWSACSIVPQTARPDLPTPEIQGKGSGVNVSVAHDQHIRVANCVKNSKSLKSCIEDLFKNPSYPQPCPIWTKIFVISHIFFVFVAFFSELFSLNWDHLEKDDVMCSRAPMRLATFMWWLACIARYLSVKSDQATPTRLWWSRLTFNIFIRMFIYKLKFWFLFL